MRDSAPGHHTGVRFCSHTSADVFSENNFNDLNPQRRARVRRRSLVAAGTAGYQCWHRDRALFGDASTRTPCSTTPASATRSRASHNGAKLWRFAYRRDGKQKEVAFGAYPRLTLAQARERREASRRLLAAGRDPSLERRLEKFARAAGGNSFREDGNTCAASRDPDARHSVGPRFHA
jgi:hypothetical protein